MLEVKVENGCLPFGVVASIAAISPGSLEMRRFKHVVMLTRHSVTLDPTPPTSPTARRR
jgi:hypothetical protein